jgi:hypothetical protein
MAVSGNTGDPEHCREGNSYHGTFQKPDQGLAPYRDPGRGITGNHLECTQFFPSIPIGIRFAGHNRKTGKNMKVPIESWRRDSIPDPEDHVSRSLPKDPVDGILQDHGLSNGEHSFEIHEGEEGDFLLVGEEDLLRAPPPSSLRQDHSADGV